MKLNIHLYRDDVREFQDCLRPVTDKRQYKQIGEGIVGEGATFRIYRTRAQAKVPPWVTLIQEHVDEDTLEDVKNLNQAAIILLRVPTGDGKRFFAISHGFGHFLVDRDRIELGFGLKTTLNAIDPDKVNFMDSRNIEMQARQKRVVSNIGVGLPSLAYEGDTEILRIAGGECEDQTLGLRVDGSDGIHVTLADVAFEDLPGKCRELYDVYRTDKYKERFSFIDDKSFVKETDVVRALEERLVAALQAEQSDAKVAVVPPDQIDQRDCAQYQIFGLSGDAPLRGDLGMPMVHRYLAGVRRRTGVQTDHLRRVRLLGLDAAGEVKSVQESLASYLTFETEHEGARFVLSNGKWYQIDKSYFERIQAQLNALRSSETPPLQEWTLGLKKSATDPQKQTWMHDEGLYNQQYLNDGEFLVLDRKNCKDVGLENDKTQVEIADLFHWPTKKLLCVKRWDRSRTMSHLLSQASVSAQLLRRAPKYRDDLLRQIQDKWPERPFPQDPDDFLHGITFVYVIASHESSPMDVDRLPVLSKVNMLKHVQIIQLAGFKVETRTIKMVQRKGIAASKDAGTTAISRKAATPGRRVAAPQMR